APADLSGGAARHLPTGLEPGCAVPVSPGSYRHAVFAGLDPHAPRPRPFISGAIPKAHDRGGRQPRQPEHRGAGRARAHVSAARRDAEVQLRVMQTLKDSQERLKVIIDTSPSAVITADERGMITDWNRKAEAIFGWSRDEAVGRTLTATIIPRRYREAHRRGMTRFVETGEGRLLGRTVELTALHRDGREFPVEISVSPTSRSGPRVSFVAFLTDISQRRITERLRNVQFAVTRPLANAESWSEAAPQVLEGICETLGWAAAEFWAVDKDADLLRWEHGWYRPSKDLTAFQAASRDVTFTRGVGLVGRVWATGRAASIADAAGEASPRAALFTHAGLHA